MSSWTAIGVEAPSLSIAKEKSCGCCAKAVESIKLRQFKMVNSSAYPGTDTTQPTWLPQWMIKATKFSQGIASAGTETA
jgi:hypothetical protein